MQNPHKSTAQSCNAPTANRVPKAAAKAVLSGLSVYQAASCCPSAVVPSRPSHMPGRYPARNAAPSQTAQSGRRADMVLRFGSLVRSCGSAGRRSAVRAALISGLSAGLSLHYPADLPAAELSAASHYCPASLLLRPRAVMPPADKPCKIHHSLARTKAAFPDTDALGLPQIPLPPPQLPYRPSAAQGPVAAPYASAKMHMPPTAAYSFPHRSQRPPTAWQPLFSAVPPWAACADFFQP